MGRRLSLLLTVMAILSVFLVPAGQASAASMSISVFNWTDFTDYGADPVDIFGSQLWTVQAVISGGPAKNIELELNSTSWSVASWSVGSTGGFYSCSWLTVKRLSCSTTPAGASANLTALQIDLNGPGPSSGTFIARSSNPSTVKTRGWT